MPALLSSVSGTRDIIGHLETTYLANRDENLAFGLVGDMRASAEPTRQDDGDIAEAAVRGISELNERYEAEHGARPFHLLIRERTYNESEGTWMGWERKRGALTELIREMRGETNTTFVTKLGDTAFRHSCVFTITLDSDTVLPRDGARKLISTIAHPLNRARWTPGQRRVMKGYGLLQPRVGMTLPGSRRSRFAAMYSGPTGIDPYSGAVSDTYQDVFGEGSFTGKGIFEVDVFAGVLEGRFPENSLLSHDLVEGSFLRTALASDIEVLDDYPANYLAAASRLHRWVRGDWQTLPWLAPRARNTAGQLGGQPSLRPAPLEDVRQPAPFARPTGNAADARLRVASSPQRRALLADHHAAAHAVPRVFLTGRRSGLPASKRHVCLHRSVDPARLRQRHVAWCTIHIGAPAPGLADGRCDRAGVVSHDHLPQASAGVGDRGGLRKAERARPARRSGARWVRWQS